MAKGPAGESVLQRAVRIFEVFTPEHPALGVNEVARRAGLPVTTASRLIAELVDLGLLERLPDRQVRASLRWWELAQRASPALGLRGGAKDPSPWNSRAPVPRWSSLPRRRCSTPSVVREPASCRQGTCGTCETTVLAGVPDHRDALLSDHERAAGDCLFVCASCSCSDALVLDL